jgi:ribosomal protein S18 acetylase RimI-like enzyme
MDMRIRPMRDNESEDLVRLAVLAWPPVFRSFEQILGRAIYLLIWPEWRTNQGDAVRRVCSDCEGTTVLVAEVDGAIAGFLAYRLDTQDKTGTVRLLAVHPEFQNRGIATELNKFAIKQMKESGMRLACVETGGDPSHAPARRAYEKAGYKGLPIVRYYQDL